MTVDLLMMKMVPHCGLVGWWLTHSSMVSYSQLSIVADDSLNDVHVHVYIIYITCDILKSKLQLLISHKMHCVHV